MSNVHKILDEIERLVLDSKRVPLLNRTLVNEDQLLDLLENLREQLPVEIEQARQVAQQRQAILGEAQKKAEHIMALAESKSKELIQHDKVVLLATEEAERVRRELEADIQRQQEGADKYAEEVLAELEAKVSRALQIVQNGRQFLTAHGQKAFATEKQ